MRTCKSCGLEKPLSDFYRNKIISDGYENTCKECAKKRSLEWRLKNPDRVRENNRVRNQLPESKAYQKMWIVSPAGKASHARTVQKWRIKNRNKCRAHKKLNNAIIRGDITRLPCEKCGAVKVDAHHDDYSKPLEVRWLCRKHHIEHHRNAIANAAYEAKVAKGEA